MDRKQLQILKATAARCRRHVLRMVQAGGAGHLGGALSCIDMLVALYFHEMKVKAEEPDWPQRDRFILSAGHKCMAQYAALAEKGYFPEEVLDTYGSLKSPIPGHPDMYKLPGIEANTGALGHGLSIANGMALALRLDASAARVFVMLGDGELPEGSNWEAAAVAAHHRLDNVVAFLDNNDLQISGRVGEVMSMASIAEKFRAFGWAVREVDGNAMEEILEVLEALPIEKGRPSLILAKTIKGKGISFAEDQVAYHYWKPDSEELQAAIAELDQTIEKLEKEANA